jgi:hypothetical protein
MKTYFINLTAIVLLVLTVRFFGTEIQSMYGGILLVLFFIMKELIDLNDKK